LTKQACIYQGKYYLFTVGMSESLYRKLLMLAAKMGRKKVDQSADAVGGWIEGGGRVSAGSSRLQGSEELLQIIQIL
jgi:hypothetical protein